MRLRPMTMDDADFMLEMKNYPETRQYAIVSKEEIKKDDHYAWLAKNIMYFRIIETDNAGPIGAVRVFGGEISIWVDRKYWGLGVVTTIVKRVAEPGMIAKVVDGNIGSLRAFIKAGFIPVAHSAIEKCYILEKP